MKSDPTAEIDTRFSDPEAGPTPWPDVLLSSQTPSCTARHSPRRRPAARDRVLRRRSGGSDALLRRDA